MSVWSTCFGTNGAVVGFFVAVKTLPFYEHFVPSHGCRGSDFVLLVMLGILLLHVAAGLSIGKRVDRRRMALRRSMAEPPRRSQPAN